MNPTAGSFTINPRLQRHFSVFAVSFPGLDALESIYRQIFEQHLSSNKFPAPVMKVIEPLVKAALTVHTQCNTTFLPTAIKFHYIFNLRDLSNIFQGMLFSTRECLNSATKMARLYMHEARRVYCDKLTEKKDQEMFDTIMQNVCSKEFEDLDKDELFSLPNNFCHFAKVNFIIDICPNFSIYRSCRMTEFLGCRRTKIRCNCLLGKHQYYFG